MSLFSLCVMLMTPLSKMGKCVLKDGVWEQPIPVPDLTGGQAQGMTAEWPPWLVSAK